MIELEVTQDSAADNGRLRYAVSIWSKVFDLNDTVTKQGEIYVTKIGSQFVVIMSFIVHSKIIGFAPLIWFDRMS